MNTPDLTTYEQLPLPGDLYAGISGTFTAPPHDILVFYRSSAREARDYDVRAMHHRFVLCLCIEGGVDFMVEDQVFAMRPNEVLLLFPHQPHYFGPFTSETIQWLFISFELAELKAISPLRNSVLPMTPAAWEYANHVVAAYQAGLEGHRRRARNILPWTTLLLNDLLEKRQTQTPANMLALLDSEHDPAKQRLRRVAEYVHAHLEAPLNLATVAREAGCSESLLRKLFREQAGISIGRFIRQARIHNACRLLHTTGLSVTQIAYRCGFSSPYAFSRTFKQMMGLAPLPYRKRLGG